MEFDGSLWRTVCEESSASQQAQHFLELHAADGRSAGSWDRTRFLASELPASPVVKPLIERMQILADDGDVPIGDRRLPRRFTT